MSKCIPNKGHSLSVLIFCIHLKKTAPKLYQLFGKLMVNILYRKIRVNDDIGVSKVVTSRLQTRNKENHQKIRRCEIASIVGQR